MQGTRSSAVSSSRAAHLAALCAILLSGALSAYWAFRIPIFQAPDEPAHFDYAMSIYSAHRLVRLSDGKPGWVVSPYTDYLMHAVDFDRIAWHSSMRVPNGYGTRSFFDHLDSQAPSLRTSSGRSGYINYIVPSYPFGFYALEALWMHIVGLFTGSLVAAFFAARLLCVLLMMLGLYFSYRTALILGVPPVAAVALTAAVGLFPLTSFVSSYIQPDNLAFTLVAAALFFAVCLRKRLTLGTYVGLGLSLGLLAITKYQFFLAVALPSVALAALALWQQRPIVTRKAARLAALLLPSLLLLGIQWFYVDAPGGSYRAPPLENSGYLQGIALLGPLPALAYLLTNSFNAFTECFSSGLCAATFWQVVGWFDTPIVIVNGQIERIVRAAVSLFSMTTAVLVALLAVRNGLRIAACIVRRHTLSGLRAAVSDPVFNSYLLFAAIILALYLMTNNSFAVEGRHWYPFIFVSLLCFVWYAPRAIRRSASGVSKALALLLLCYSLIASPYAIAAISNRYYGPATSGFVASTASPSQIVSGRAGTLWSVVDARYHAVPADGPFSFVRGTPLLASGGVLPQGKGYPTTTSVMVDQRLAVPVLSNQYHARVGEAFHDSRYGYDAFYAFIHTAHLGEGAHLVSAYAQIRDRNLYQPIFPARVFFITQSDGRFSPSSLRTLVKAPIVSGSVLPEGACRGTASLAGRTIGAFPSALLLFSGDVPPQRLKGKLEGAWFLVDSRPFPARLAGPRGSFLGTIPTDGFVPGTYDVTAYAIFQGSPVPRRVAQASRFRILTGGSKAPLVPAPAGCLDPLGQLAKHNTIPSKDAHGTS
jgi:hypothetical protein